MATITYHNTEDSAATVTGFHHTVRVVDQGNGYTEIFERLPPTPYRANGLNDWVTVAELSTYNEAINFAELYADGRTT